MISYSIVDTEQDFSEKKTFLDTMLAKYRKDQISCSYAVLKEYDGYANAVSHEYIYTFQDKA